jgi:hypothetical protein
MSETTYWQCECGQVWLNGYCSHESYNCKRSVKDAKQVEVHPLGTGAELKRLRAELDAVLDENETRIVHGRGSRAMVDAFNRRTLGKEAT